LAFLDKKLANRDGRTFRYFLSKQETLYNAAKNTGFLLSDDDVKDETKKLRQETEKAVNYSDFEVYLSGRGITADEYWAGEFDNIKRDCTIQDYLSSIQSAYAKENNIENWTGKDLNAWNDYKEKFISNLVKDQNVKIIK
jgi:hypothetical protein